MTKIIRWTNKFSQEQGYVMSVDKTEGHFVNTFDASEAKVFKRNCDVTRVLNQLESFGETENNAFDVVDVEE